MTVSLQVLTNGQNVLVLAPHPGEETLGCGGLIAEACARGRPPYVAILADGSGTHPASRAWPPARLAALRQQETRAATAALGLDPDRLLFVGLFDGTVPASGPFFDAVVGAIALVMWRQDCNVICAPADGAPHSDHRAAHAIAVAVAQRTGVRRFGFSPYAALPEGTGLRLDIARHRAVKDRALALHASQHGLIVDDDPGGFRLPAQPETAFECYTGLS